MRLEQRHRATYKRRHATAHLVEHNPQGVDEIKTGKTVLIAAHGNSLRAIVKHLDEISDADIAALNIPTGIPLVYELDEETLKPLKKGGRYLDPEAEAKIAAVANQGK